MSQPRDRRTDDESPAPEPPPESAMGGASDFGAHGKHPASSRAAKREHRPAEPDRVAGDAAIERRHGPNPDYHGPERRMGRR